ncbi:hypothetical protein ABZS66_16960 [Dactylosporangium sp. NPDC005572]
MMAEAKISPDLIIHEQGNPRGNFLAIEVKRAGHRKRRAWPNGPTLEDF